MILYWSIHVVYFQTKTYMGVTASELCLCPAYKSLVEKTVPEKSSY